MCSAPPKTHKKSCHTCFYDVYFKSYDTPRIRVAAILDLSNMATRGQIQLVSRWFLKGLGHDSHW